MANHPQKIGPYQIEGELGRGGMGVVFRGVDPRLKRSVAIKSVSPEVLGNPSLLQRFEREARTLAALEHPHICRIYDTLEEAGQRYLILECLSGPSLTELFADGPLGIRGTLDMAIQIADGLAAAHEAGIVHRDLKPDNLREDESGCLKLLDFGLALRADKAAGPTQDTQPLTTSATEPGTVLGTAAYMSPEQARGEAADRRTDLWALGVLLFEALTGSNPFARGTSADSMAAVLQDEIDLSILPPATPSDLVSLIGRCLQKDSQRRQRDAADASLILQNARAALNNIAAPSERMAEIREGRWRIEDSICRELDREGFDALLPGWEMRYSDNQRESDVLILWIPSIGGDHQSTAWLELIAESPYRMVVLTPVGMEPGELHRPVVSLENQFRLLRALSLHLKRSLRAKKTIISGYSCGSIMALRCAAGEMDEGIYDGVLTIDADLQESDCFLTRTFASMEFGSSKDIIQGLQKFSKSCETIPEWLTLHQHVVEFIHKTQNDFSPLIQQGRDLSAPYLGVKTGAESPFVGFLKAAVENVGTVRCVFHESLENRRLLGEIRMLHLDNQVLGPRFEDRILSFLPVAEYVGMMKTDQVLEQLEWMVGEVLEGTAGIG